MIARVCMIAILATCVSATLLTTNEYESMFSAHVEKYNLDYSPSEMFTRLATFTSNIDAILTHNMEAEKGKHTFTLAANQFSDWTNEEYRQKMNGLKRDKSSARPMATSTHTNNNVQDLPASWDWVDHGAVTPVKNQGQCGSCWAFSATAAMEGSNFQNTGKLISLSEQMCVDCVNGGADTCDMGGEMHDCYLQVIKQGGDNLESDYPYQATSGHQCRYNASKAVATEFTGYKNVTQGDENALQVASQKAVISVGIDASSFEFQFYSSGVYNVPSCKNGWYELDHGVTVTGWGSLNGDDYWVVKNSWGNSWGKAGYIWMSRNKNNQCGIATDATFLTM